MCDTLCVIGSGRTLFAKNSDRPVNEVQLFERHPARAAGGRLRTQYIEIDDTGACEVVGSRPSWLWGFEHGVNEHRVAIGNERLWTTDDPRGRPPALIGMDLVRLGLERGGDATSAVDAMVALVEQHGQGGSGEPDHDSPYYSSFLVADPSVAWVLETSGRTWAAREVDDGAAISNRITLGTDWQRASSDVAPHSDFSTRNDPFSPAISDHRLDATRQAVATGAAALGPREIVATLRHHGERAWGAPGGDPRDVAPLPREMGDDLRGITVCQHVDTLATTASMVATLDRAHDRPLRLWIALGSPCASVYVPCSFDALPPQLALEATWRRFAALARCVETKPEMLAEVRETLAPIEADLWEAADSAYSSGDRNEIKTYVSGAFATVDRALIELGS